MPLFPASCLQSNGVVLPRRCLNPEAGQENWLQGTPSCALACKIATYQWKPRIVSNYTGWGLSYTVIDHHVFPGFIGFDGAQNYQIVALSNASSLIGLHDTREEPNFGLTIPCYRNGQIYREAIINLGWNREGLPQGGVMRFFNGVDPITGEGPIRTHGILELTLHHLLWRGVIFPNGFPYGNCTVYCDPNDRGDFGTHIRVLDNCPERYCDNICGERGGRFAHLILRADTIIYRRVGLSAEPFFRPYEVYLEPPHGLARIVVSFPVAFNSEEELHARYFQTQKTVRWWSVGTSAAIFGPTVPDIGFNEYDFFATTQFLVTDYVTLLPVDGDSRTAIIWASEQIPLSEEILNEDFNEFDDCVLRRVRPFYRTLEPGSPLISVAIS